MWKALLTVMVVLGSCLVPAWTQPLPMSRTNFPGFSIELPRAKTVLEDSREPTSGQHHRLIDTTSLAEGSFLPEPEVRVMWLDQTMSYEDFNGPFLESLVSRRPSGFEDAQVLKRMRLSDSRWLAVIGQSDHPAAGGMASCNPKLSVVVIVKLHTTVEAAAQATRSMLESIRCGKVVDAERLQAAVKFPLDIGRVPDSRVQLYRSLSGERLSIGYAQGDVFSEPELWRLGALSMQELGSKEKLSDEMANDVEIAERLDLRPTRLVRLDIPGKDRALYVGGVHCEEAKVTFLVRMELPERNDALAEQRLLQIDCPQKGWVDALPFDTVAKAACSQGDQRACEILRQSR